MNWMIHVDLFANTLSAAIFLKKDARGSRGFQCVDETTHQRINASMNIGGKGIHSIITNNMMPFFPQKSSPLLAFS